MKNEEDLNIDNLIKALDRFNDDRVELLALTGNTTAFSSDYGTLKQVLMSKLEEKLKK